MKLAPNGQPIRQASRELADEIGVPALTCLSWLSGKCDPDQTIKKWVGDILLNIMALNIKEGQGHSLREIGEFTGLSYERIRQIEEQALRKVRCHHHTREIIKELS